MTVREISPGTRLGTRSVGIRPRAGVEGRTLLALGLGLGLWLGLGLAIVTAAVGVPAVSEQAQSISVAVSAVIVGRPRAMLRTLTRWAAGRCRFRGGRMCAERAPQSYDAKAQSTGRLTPQG